MQPVKIMTNEQGEWQCPKCASKMRFVEREPVSVSNGKLVMEEAEAHYFCKECNSIYRKVVNTDYYQWHRGPVREIKDLGPVKLVKEDGVCKCPACSEKLRYVEGEPIRVVDGKLITADTEGHYWCERCEASYRRLVNTDYYQWHDK